MRRSFARATLGTRLVAAMLAITGLAGSAAGAAPLPFDDAIARILARSTSIPAQAARLEATRARALPSYFVFAPGLSVDASRTWTGGIAPEAPTRSFEAVADLNLFRFGADLAGLGAARADIRAQEALLDDAVLKAEDEAVKAVIDLIQARQASQVRARFVHTQEELLRIARERFRGGYLPQQEVDKVSIDLENERSRLADAQVLEAQAEAALVALLGSADIELAWPWRDRLPGPEARALAQAAFDIAARPDYLAAASTAEAEDRRAWRARVGLLPSVDARLAAGNLTTLSPDGAALYSGPAWKATLGVTWALWDHGSAYSIARAQAFTRAEADTAQERAARQGRAEWQAARAGYAIAADSAVSRQKSAEVARKLYEDNLLRFQKGRASANELSVDQNRLLENELFAIQGWSSAHLAYARLCHSLGRRLQGCVTADSGATVKKSP